LINLRQTIALFVLLLCGWVARGQDTAKLETRQVYLPITKIQVFNNSPDSVLIYYGYSKQIPTNKFQPIRAMHSYMETANNDTTPKRMYKEAGAGFIIKNDTLTMGFIKLYNKQDSLKTWADFISIDLPVPVLEYRSIFSTLAYNAINFTDLDSRLLYSQPQIIFHDSKKLEDSIYSNILADLKNSYEKSKDRKDLLPVWYKKIAEGRFKDKTPLEVIRDVNRKELESFLMYVASYPVGYTSTLYKFADVFATWALYNSPYSYIEIKKTLFPVYKNKETFRQLLPIYKRDILKESTVKTMENDVIALANALQYQQAEELADFTIVLALEAGDIEGLPWAYIAMAQVKQDQSKFAEAIAYCDKAIATGLKSDDKEVEIQASVKKGFCLYAMARYNEADTFLVSVLKKLKIYKPGIPENLYNNYNGKVYEYRAMIHKISGNYLLSMMYLDSAITFNKIGNTLDAQLKNADNYKFKGEILNGQGKPADALEAFNGAVEIYWNNIEMVKWANALNEVANCRFKLGDYERSIEDARKAAAKLIQRKDTANAGYSYAIIGQSFWNMGKYDSAVISHKQAIEYRKKGNDTSNIAWSWKQIAELYGLSGQKKSALNSYDSSAFYYRSIRDSAGLGEVYNMKGNVYLNDESYKRAIELFEKAKGINSKTTVDGLFNLGNAWNSIDTTKSRYYFQECRKLSITTGNTSQQFYAALNLAQLDYKNGNYLSGKKYHDECTTLSQEIKTEECKAHCVALIGYYFETNTMLDSALLYYDSSATIFSRVNKSQEVSKLLSASTVLISKGDFSKAEDVILRAMKIADTAKIPLTLGEALATSTFLYGRTGEFSKGLANSDRADSIFNESGFNIRLANAYISRGALFSSMGEYKKAILTYLVADSIFKSELVKESRSTVYNNIGVVYAGQKDYASALKNFDISLNMLPKGVVNESYLLTQGNRAECLHYLNRSKEAETLLLKVLPQATKLNLNRIASGIAITMGDVYLAQKKFEEAKNLYTNALNYALASREREKVIETLTGLGRINNQTKKIDDAEKIFRQAVSVVEEMNGGTGWECYYELGLIYFNRSKFDSTANYFKKAVDLLDKSMENLFGGEDAKKIFNKDTRKSDLYKKITYVYFKLGNVSQAWEYANRYSLAGLREFSGAVSFNSTDEGKKDALQKMFSMQKELQMLNATADKQVGTAKEETLKEVKIREEEYTNFLNGMVNKYHDLEVYLHKVQASDLKTYQESIPEDLAVLQYIQNDKTLMIICLTHDDLAIDTITANPEPYVKSFTESVKNGLLSMRTGTVDDAIKNAKDLADKVYRMLIASVDDTVRARKRFCIMPTGIYSNMPFQCLGHYDSANQFHYLIEDHSIFYAHNASLFLKTIPPGSIKNDLASFAAFGIPDPKLKFNLEEVQTIARIVGGDSTVLYIDDRATKNKAVEILKQKKIIHFATHGVLDYTSDFSQSYLKLVPDKDNDGRLTMKEVNTLKISGCDMVILSACQTAVSKTLARDWNISPANSFLQRNVRSVVASLWKVDDEPTGMLMEYFYHNLKTMEHEDKAEALRLAQLQLLKNPRFAHPNYWGAFALYGDWR